MWYEERTSRLRIAEFGFRIEKSNGAKGVVGYEFQQIEDLRSAFGGSLFYVTRFDDGRVNPVNPGFNSS